MSSVNSILLSDVQLQIQFSFFLFVLIYHYVVNMKLCPIFMPTKLNMQSNISHFLSKNMALFHGQ